MRKFLLASALVFGLMAPGMAASLDDVTFADLSSSQRTAYYQLMSSPCSTTMELFQYGNQQVVSGLITAIAVKWRLLTSLQMTNDDGTFFGAICGSHPGYTVGEMVTQVVMIREAMQQSARQW